MDVRVNPVNMIYKIIPNSFEELEVDFNAVKDKFQDIKKRKFNNQYFRIRYKNLKTKIKNYINLS